jgi:hypothetical protein
MRRMGRHPIQAMEDGMNDKQLTEAVTATFTEGVAARSISGPVDGAAFRQLVDRHLRGRRIARDGDGWRTAR